MSAFLTRFNFPELMGFLVVGGGLLMGFVAIVGSFWTDIRKKEIAAGLKQDMLNRGMSAEQIRLVLDAGTKRSVTEVPGIFKSSTEVA
jgi:hypothetical protein